MTEFYDRAVSQLDSIVVFMALRQKAVFEKLQTEWDKWVDDPDSTSRPEGAERFEEIILHSALLLGTTYFEAYLADIVHACYRSKPKMLATRQRTVSWEDVVHANTYDNILSVLIDRELAKFTRLPVKEMLEYFSKYLKLPEVGDHKIVGDLREASLVRNLITHNSAVASRELEQANARFKAGMPIAVNAADVHRYGLAARAVMWQLDPAVSGKFAL